MRYIWKCPCILPGFDLDSFNELGVVLPPRLDFSFAESPAYFHVTYERFLSPRCRSHTFRSSVPITPVVSGNDFVVSGCTIAGGSTMVWQYETNFNTAWYSRCSTKRATSDISEIEGCARSKYDGVCACSLHWWRLGWLLCLVEFGTLSQAASTSSRRIEGVFFVLRTSSKTGIEFMCGFLLKEFALPRGWPNTSTQVNTAQLPSYFFFGCWLILLFFLFLAECICRARTILKTSQFLKKGSLKDAHEKWFEAVFKLGPLWKLLCSHSARGRSRCMEAAYADSAVCTRKQSGTRVSYRCFPCAWLDCMLSAAISWPKKMLDSSGICRSATSLVRLVVGVPSVSWQQTR